MRPTECILVTGLCVFTNVLAQPTFNAQEYDLIGIEKQIPDMSKRGLWKRKPRDDDPRVQFMNAQCAIRGNPIDPTKNWVWTSGWCDSLGVSISCIGLARDGAGSSTGTASNTGPTTFYSCPQGTKCLQTANWINPFGKVTTMAQCVPVAYNTTLQKIRKLGRWKSGLMCGYLKLRADSGVRAAMVEMAVWVHRVPVPNSRYSDDINAHQLFMWDITDENNPIVLDVEEEKARVSVAVRVVYGKPKVIKSCITAPDYYLYYRENEVMANFTHTCQYDKIML